MPLPAKAPIASAFQAAEPRPAASAGRDAKKNYAQRLSDQLADVFADALRSRFPGITPKEGQEREKKARTAKGYKKLDVNYSTIELGPVALYAPGDAEPARARPTQVPPIFPSDDAGGSTEWRRGRSNAVGSGQSE